MLIEWHEEMSVGVAVIDEEHKKLISFLNLLHEAVEEGKGKEVINQTLLEVMAYTTYHFNHEETLFAGTDYPEKAFHVQEHEKITQRLLDLQSRMRLAEAEQLCVDLLIFLKSWLVSHILTIDMKYAAFIKERVAAKPTER